jgi:RNA polymerase sigma-70 factor (ECF subfamily)
MSDNLPEEDTLSRAIGGDLDAFSLLYQQYVNRIYNYVYYRTSSPQDAEDLTARVFQRALAHINRYEDKGIPFSAWLYRIAHNLVANWHRDNTRSKEVSIEDQLDLRHPGEPPEAALVLNQENEVLLKAIRKLPAERQQLIILKFVDRLSNAEIGEIMNKSEGAIKSLYHRTLISLRVKIKKLNIE